MRLDGKEGRSILSILLAALAASTIELQPVSAAGAARDRQTDWEKTVEAARGEKKVVLYGSEVYQEIFQEFEKKFLEIKVVHVMGLGTDTVQRIVAERRAGKYLADLYLSGTATGMLAYETKILAPIKPGLILSAVVDKSMWWKRKHRYADAEDQYLFVFAESVMPFAAYNTRRVNPKEFRSYWDLLDPKWKGKIVAFDPLMGSAVNNLLLFLYDHPELGPKFLRRLLTEMDLGITRDRRQLVDWLATGKYELSFLTTPTRARLSEAKDQGLPVDWFSSKTFKEGTLGNTLNASVGLLDRAPHPNAARVAINWLLSREGQLLYQKLNPPADSLRIDIPKDHVPAYARRAGVKYTEAYTPTQENMEPVYRLINEVWRRGR